jgi:hypothetical protein
MFRKEMLRIDVVRAMQLAFEAFGELVAMDDASRAFKEAHQEAIEKAERSPQQQRSLALPHSKTNLWSNNIREAISSGTMELDLPFNLVDVENIDFRLISSNRAGSNGII